MVQTIGTESNHIIVKNTIITKPGLRFYQIKNETGLANGTLQHHLASLTKLKEIRVIYENTTPRYFSPDIEDSAKIIIRRLGQNTPSKIIKLLLKKECQTFAQIVKYSKKTPGTVSLYKNKLLSDKIIYGDTSSCSCSKDVNKIKYRLTDPAKIRTLVMEYGKTSLEKSADNLSDIYMSLK